MGEQINDRIFGVSFYVQLFAGKLWSIRRGFEVPGREPFGNGDMRRKQAVDITLVSLVRQKALKIGIRNDDLRSVKKIRAHKSSLPSISHEFAWDERCD